MNRDTQPSLALTVALFALLFLVPAWPWLSGARDDPLRREVHLLSAGRVHGARLRERAVAVLGARSVRRLAERRRPAVDAGLAAACAARVRECGAGLSGDRCGGVRLSVPRRARDHPVLPRPRLACGGRARRGARLRVRRLRERAAPAYRAGDQPCVSAAGAVAARARARPLVMALRRARGRGGCADRAWPRSGRAAGALSARRLRRSRTGAARALPRACAPASCR